MNPQPSNPKLFSVQTCLGGSASRLCLEVWKQDLVDYFCWLLQGDGAELDLKDTPGSLARSAELKHRLLKLQSRSYHQWYGDELQRYCRFRLLKSQRETALSPFQEHARAVRTWQSFDWNLWRACLEIPPEPRVAAEDLFLEQVRAGNLVLGWSDAVPFWALLQCGKTLKKRVEDREAAWGASAEQRS